MIPKYYIENKRLGSSNLIPKEGSSMMLWKSKQCLLH